MFQYLAKPLIQRALAGSVTMGAGVASVLGLYTCSAAETTNMPPTTLSEDGYVFRYPTAQRLAYLFAKAKNTKSFEQILLATIPGYDDIEKALPNVSNVTAFPSLTRYTPKPGMTDHVMKIFAESGRNPEHDYQAVWLRDLESKFQHTFRAIKLDKMAPKLNYTNMLFQAAFDQVSSYARLSNPTDIEARVGINDVKGSLSVSVPKKVYQRSLFFVAVPWSLTHGEFDGVAPTTTKGDANPTSTLVMALDMFQGLLYHPYSRSVRHAYLSIWGDKIEPSVVWEAMNPSETSETLPGALVVSLQNEDAVQSLFALGSELRKNFFKEEEDMIVVTKKDQPGCDLWTVDFGEYFGKIWVGVSKTTPNPRVIVCPNLESLQTFLQDEIDSRGEIEKLGNYEPLLKVTSDMMWLGQSASQYLDMGGDNENTTDFADFMEDAKQIGLSLPESISVYAKLEDELPTKYFVAQAQLRGVVDENIGREYIDLGEE